MVIVDKTADSLEMPPNHYTNNYTNTGIENKIIIVWQQSRRRYTNFTDFILECNRLKIDTTSHNSQEGYMKTTLSGVNVETRV